MDNKKIGNFIKSLRESKKMTQQELADKLFVERTVINKWERGINTITAPNIKRLSSFFGVSADEILAGEIYNKKNKERIDDVILDVYQKNNSLMKKIKIVSIIFFATIVMFLVYFFITFYNSVKIYDVSSEDEQGNFVSGSLTKTNEYINLILNTDALNPKSINLYFMNKGEKKYLVMADNQKIIYIKDYVFYQEYFDFSNFDEMLDNLYIEVELENETKVEKLIFTRDYSNKNLFYKQDSGFTPYTKKEQIVENEEYKSKIEMLHKRYNDKIKKLKYNGVDYTLSIFEDRLIIEYNETTDKIIINYDVFDYEYMYKMINEDTVYNVNVNTNKDNVEVYKDYEFVKEIINYLIEHDES
ncbi:MAG: helix-turn-helix transcriptional regulator [Bacilli bacterium]|nr:helix-turn-helix transcriptional regulator [Bacilli bacterium]